MADSIVGGLIGGLLVVLGIAGAQLHRVRADRWRRIQSCATEINLAIGRVLRPMFVPGSRALAEQPGWAEANHAILQALVELRVLARGPGKKLGELRYLAFALTLRLQAAMQIFQTGARHLETVDLESLTGPNRRLQELVFGPADPALPHRPEQIDAAVAYLVAHGLSADEGWYRRSR